MDFEIQKKEVGFTWIKIYSTFEKKKHNDNDQLVAALLL